jgi:AcrR family transcriptional regulator
LRVEIDAITALPDMAQREAVRQRAQDRLRRQQRDAAQRRQQLLDAALALVLERGVDRFHMRDLGQRCAYTAGALYAYFDSREALLGLVRDRLLTQWSEQLQALAARGGRPTPRGPGVGSLGPGLPDSVLRQCQLFARLLAGAPAALPLITGPWPSPEGVAPALPLERLLAVLQPCREALVGCGVSEVQARQALAQTLHWAIGRLVLSMPAPRSDAPAVEEASAFGQRLSQELGWAVPEASGCEGDAASGLEQGRLF